MSRAEIDICNNVFVKSITCSAVSADNHEVYNLISDDPASRQAGFLVAPYVKPRDVTIHLNFIQPLILNTVIIHTTVGLQVSTGFQLTTTDIHTTQMKSGNYWHEDGCPHPSIVEFSKFKGPNNCWVTSNSFHQVSKLSIRITKVKHGSTFALGRVQVLSFVSQLPGHLVSTDCSEVADNSQNALSCEPVICSTEIEWKHRSHDLLKDRSDSVPDDFLDAITSELMEKPFLLPSGLNVDESSLKRLLELAESQGKLPYDPFSYQEFSANCRPVENFALLQRMRNFKRDTRLRNSSILKQFSSPPIGVQSQNYNLFSGDSSTSDNSSCSNTLTDTSLSAILAQRPSFLPS